MCGGARLHTFIPASCSPRFLLNFIDFSPIFLQNSMKSRWKMLFKARKWILSGASAQKSKSMAHTMLVENGFILPTAKGFYRWVFCENWCKNRENHKKLSWKLWKCQKLCKILGKLDFFQFLAQKIWKSFFEVKFAENYLSFIYYSEIIGKTTENCRIQRKNAQNFSINGFFSTKNLILQFEN